MSLNNISQNQLEATVTEKRLARINQVSTNRTKDLILVLDHVSTAHNISAMLRSADAFGLQNAFIVGRELDITRGISKGAEKWLSISNFQKSQAAIDFLKQSDFEIVVLQPPDKKSAQNQISCPVFELPFEKKLALVLGSERRGVSQEFQEAASYNAFIPMFGFVESFNVSVACAITLFCSTISGAHGKRQTTSLSTEESKKLIKTWLAQQTHQTPDLGR